MRISKLAISTLILLGCASTLPASIVYTATLLGSNEVPPTGSAATGFITVTLNGNSLSIFETFSGLSAPVTGAHIHCCAPLGTNASIAVPFTSFPAITSGTYSNTFDLTQTATYTSAFLASSGGTAGGAEAALMAGLSSGQTYANIHDGNFLGGEIRGQLALTPEPATALLLLAGLFPLAATVRRRIRTKH